MNLVDVIILSIVQGISELFPISSLGHSILIQSLLNISVTKDNKEFLPFLVALHLGTSIALLIYFRDDWIKLLKALKKTIIVGKITNDFNERFIWLLIVGTIPVGLIGLFLQDPIKNLFSNPVPAAAFLIINGFILMLGDNIKKAVILHTKEKQTLAVKNLTYKESLITGTSQSFALLPGISRSGVSMVAGLILGLNYEDAAYFSFMLATPVIFAAALLEIPFLFTSSTQMLFYSIIGAVLAGITAFLSVKFLIKYFKQGNLKPYSYYSILVGLCALIYFH